MKQSTKVTNDPYVNLGIAILRRAVEDCVIKRELLRKGRKSTAGLVNDPEYYLFESDDDDFPSFTYVCEMVEINPEYLRGVIRGYLLKATQPSVLGSVERIKDKIRSEKRSEIMRSNLTSWAWDNLRLRASGLDKVIEKLKDKGDIVEDRRKRSRGWATFYMWVGE